jgi:predicted amidophosphoribosyltransferase
MSRLCAGCGSPAISGQSRFCNICGLPFPDPVQPEKTAFCTRCGANNRDPLSRFCNRCGSPVQQNPLSIPGRTCPHCGTYAPKESTFCVKCGSEITGLYKNERSTCCPSCGARIDESRYYCNHCGAYLKGHLPIQRGGTADRVHRGGMLMVPAASRPTRDQPAGTGQKRDFPDGEEDIRYLTGWRE